MRPRKYDPKTWENAKMKAVKDLIALAKNRRTMAYFKFAQLVVLPHDCKKFERSSHFHEFLGEILEETHKQYGLLTALIGHSDGGINIPADQFFELAKKHGYKTGDKGKAWRDFLLEQRTDLHRRHSTK